MSRFRIALNQADSDAKNPNRGISFKELLAGDGPTPDNVSKYFLNDEASGCKAAFTAMVEHKFCTAMGNGTASLDGFRYYMIQDFFYLKHFAYYKLEAFMKGSLADFDASETHADNDINFAKDLLSIIKGVLGVKPEVVEKTPISDSIRAYAKFEDGNVTIKADDMVVDWLKVHVVLLPCMLGYYRIADRLVNSPDILKDTVYYTSWIDPNHDSSSASSYVDFINKNLQPFVKNDDVIKQMQELFKEACKNEVATFNTGLVSEKSTTYDIIDAAGTPGGFTIQSATTTISTTKSAITANGTKLSISNYTAGSASQKWIFAIAKTTTPILEGYTIKNQDSYLVYNAKDGTLSLDKIAGTIPQTACWFVIPSTVSTEVEGSLIENAYQIIPASLDSAVTSLQDKVISLKTTTDVELQRNVLSKVQAKRSQSWVIVKA